MSAVRGFPAPDRFERVAPEKPLAAEIRSQGGLRMHNLHKYHQNVRRSPNCIDRGLLEVPKICPTCDGTLMLEEGLLKLG